MKWLTLALQVLFFVLSMLWYTHVVWQSGFDDGADVALCAVTLFHDEKYGHGGETPALQTPACKGAEAYKHTPLWQFRTRGQRP